ncbi:protein hook-like isoform X1 [Eurosta solidaginis]|uniref:protein hook-like isoform X1 n=1 Tax=Eurosta solidaginis TaxID=178769 RepID=UPI003530A47C
MHKKYFKGIYKEKTSADSKKLTQIILLIEEKSNMQQELSKLKHEIRRLENTLAEIGDDGVSLGPVQAGSVRYSELRRQLYRTKEDLVQSDAARKDLKLKVHQQENEIQTIQQPNDDLIVNIVHIHNATKDLLFSFMY